MACWGSHLGTTSSLKCGMLSMPSASLVQLLAETDEMGADDLCDSLCYVVQGTYNGTFSSRSASFRNARILEMAFMVAGLDL